MIRLQFAFMCITDLVVSTRIWSSPYDGQIRLQRAQYTNQGLLEGHSVQLTNGELFAMISMD